MKMAFEEAASNIREKRYKDVAAALYEEFEEEIVKVSEESKETWLTKIEDKMVESHNQILSLGLWSSSQKEMSLEAYDAVRAWLLYELKMERKSDDAWRLSGY